MNVAEKKIRQLGPLYMLFFDSSCAIRLRTFHLIFLTAKTTYVFCDGVLKHIQASAGKHMDHKLVCPVDLLF